MPEKTVYLDHAATTPLDKDAFEVMKPYFTEIYGNADSPHAVGRKAMTAVDRARDTFAELLGAKPSEIYFTSGGTESDNWAILGGAYAKKREGRMHVLLSAVEHHAALSCGERLQKEGFDVEYLPVDEKGVVRVDVLKEKLRTDTALVGVMSVNNETGAIQPVGEISRLAKEKGALFFTDAVQLAPYERINVKDPEVDLLSISSHKFYGPKGLGVLYIRSGVKMEKLVGGGEQERGLRGGTLNVPAIVGAAAAFEKNAATVYEMKEKIAGLRALFLKEISELEGVTVNGGEGLPAILNLRVSGVENTALLYRMDLEGVAIAAGSACASASVKPSHVLLAMGLTEAQAKNSVRISFGKDNEEEEILFAARKFVKTVRAIRNS